LHPGGVIELREKGRRKTFSLPIAAVYEMAVLAELRAERRERRARKKVAK
jgi:hypothetical protein